MNNFIYYTPKTNLIVTQLLHHSAPRYQAELNQQFMVVIEFRVIV